jgi:hypothetical protein
VKKLLPLAALTVILSGTACEEEVEPPPPPPDRLAPTSPVNVLKNVELAFNDRDINLFKDMLSENFIFYFDPDELGRRPGGKRRIPESYSYTEIVRRVNDLFETAYSISMSIDTRNVRDPGPAETTFRADNIKVTLIVKETELKGFTYERYGHVEFEKYRADAGENYWRITKWWDRARPAYGEYLTLLRL